MYVCNAFFFKKHNLETFLCLCTHREDLPNTVTHKAVYKPQIVSSSILLSILGESHCGVGVVNNELFESPDDDMEIKLARRIRYTFSSNHNIHKSLCGLLFLSFRPFNQ